MMNVDDALRIVVHELIGENLHVAGQHYEIGGVIVDQCLNSLLRVALVFFGDRHDRVGNLVEIGERLIVRVIGDDQRNIAGEFAALMAVEQIHEAVIIFRNQNDHARSMRRLCQPPLHLELFGNGREVLAEVGETFITEIDVEVFGIELHPHKEQAGFLVCVFVGVQDVAVMAVDEIGNGGDFSLAVGTTDQEDGGVLHGVGKTLQATSLR